jgi:sigma-E factor negative regulatory protein RseB
LVIYNQKNEKVVIEKRHGQNMFPAVLPTNLESIRANYSLHSGDIERIADRQAQIYLLESKDGLRYSYKLWVDSEYGLLLKSVLLNSHNEVIESIAFNQVALMQVGGLDWFRPKIDSKKNYVMEDEVPTSADTGTANAWSIKELPAGYRKVDQMIRMVHGKSLPVTHVVFSDGLAYVSLFIEPTTLKSKASTKATQAVVGNTSYYMNVIDGHQVTVVGEVPEITAAQIGNAVIFNK